MWTYTPYIQNSYRCNWMAKPHHGLMTILLIACHAEKNKLMAGKL